MAQSGITMYGTTWCGDCSRAKMVLDARGVAYRWVDIGEDRAARDHVRQLQNGGQTVPTIVFEDGSILIEPSNAELAQKLDGTSEAVT